MKVRKWLVPMAWIAGIVAVIAAVAVIIMNSPLSFFFYGAGAGGRTIYIWDLCVGQDDLWVVYPTDANDLSEFGIYSHGKEERGDETRPHIKGTPIWDSAEERFYAVSGKQLTVYETLTGNTIEYKLKRKYKSVSKAEDGDFILRQEDGDQYRVSPETGQEMKTEPEDAAPQSDYEVRGSGVVVCYDRREERELWRVKASSLVLTSGAQVLATGERVWIWAKGGHGLYAADIRTGEFSAVETHKMLNVVRTEEGLLCFGRTEEGIGSEFCEVGIYMLHYDGTRSSFGGGFRTPPAFNVYHRFTTPMKTAIFQGKVYYAFDGIKSGKVYCADTIYDIVDWNLG